MKKFRQLLLAILVGFSSINVARAASIWDASQVNYGATTKEVTASYDYDEATNTFYVTYTIPEGFEEEQIIVSPQLFSDELDGRVPGDGDIVIFNVVNLSNYDYSYVNDSFVVSTADAAGDVSLGTGFDGEGIYQAPWRTSNAALRALFGGFMTAGDVDDIEGELLAITNEDGTQKYPGGLDDLDEYYLDYYNSLFIETEENPAESLEDFVNYPILTYKDSGERYGYKDTLHDGTYLIASGIFDGMPYVRETNQELIELSYNFLYNNGFGIVFGDDIENIDTTVTFKEYAIGSYMRGEVSVEDYILENFGTVKAHNSDTDNSISIAYYISGPYVANAYQMYSMDFYLGLKLEKVEKMGTVIAHYVDEDGNRLGDDIITTDVVGDPYETTQLEFDGYTFKTVEGNTIGTYIDGVIEVTYIYEFTSGIGGGEPIEPVEPSIPNVPEEILPPQTGIMDILSSKMYGNSTNDEYTKASTLTTLFGSISLLGLIRLRRN